MKIIINNKQEEFDQNSMTVRQLLNQKKFTFSMLVVKLNKKLIKKEDYDSVIIRDGDDVSVLHLMSGG